MRCVGSWFREFVELWFVPPEATAVNTDAQHRISTNWRGSFAESFTCKST